MLDPAARNLSGTPLAEQLKQALRARIAELGMTPKLAIIHISPDPGADTYVELKQQYGVAIGAAVEVLRPPAAELDATIARLNDDPGTHGIIIQLPLPDQLASQTEKVLASVELAKDVDGLAPNTPFITAGPRGIMELLDAYGVVLDGVTVSLIGTGKLFGAPLLRALKQAGAHVEAFNLEHPIKPEVLQASKVVIGATGEARLLVSELIAPGTVVVDATGVDTDPALQQRQDIRITPAQGGVGPMTVAALFENLVDAVQNLAK